MQSASCSFFFSRDLLSPSPKGEYAYRASLCFVCGTLPQLERLHAEYLFLEELQDYQKLTHQARQLSFLLGRFAAKRAALEYFEPELLSSTQATEEAQLLGALQAFRVKKGVFLFPLFVDKKACLSISHSAHCAVAIVSEEEHPLAVDLECVSKQRRALCRRSEKDLTLLLGFIAQSELIVLESSTLRSMVWSAREALGKVLKTGLTLPFQFFELKRVCHEGEGGFLVFYYKYFIQYKVLVFFRNSFVFSMACPKYSNPDLKNILKCIDSFISMD